MTEIYGNAADFRTYHEERGRTIPATWDDAHIEAALLVGSEWLDNRYKHVFIGYPTDGYTQEREWPRAAAYTNTDPSYTFATDEIPKEVPEATYEAAFREATKQGSLEVDFTRSKYKRVRVDGAIEVEYAGITEQSQVQVQIGIIDSLMSPLIDLSASGSFSSLSGSVNRV